MNAGDPDHESTAGLELLRRSNEAAAGRRGASSFRHAPNRFQSDQEIDVCCDLARSLRAQGKGDIQEISKNEECNFPDCLATLDGKPIGIEVWELMDPDNAHTSWPIDRFCRKVKAAIREKDQKAQKNERLKFLATLSQLFLVIHTDEAALSPDVLRAYLEQLQFPRPTYINQAFVLGPYEHANNAHIRGHRDEVAEKGTQFTAFPIRWSTQ